MNVTIKNSQPYCNSLPIVLALYLILLSTNFAKNYVDMIKSALILYEELLYTAVTATLNSQA